MKKRGGFYWVENEPYASVTNIIKVLDKPALRFWFGQMVYRAFAADATLDEKSALAAPWRASGKAKDRGSTVHSIVESFKTTKEPIKNIPDGFKGYADAFYKWIDDNKVKVFEHERTVVSKEHQFAGTLDLIVELNGSKEKTIIDVKTGKGLYAEVQLQLSAYRQALKEGGIEANMAALLLKDDGTYIYETYKRDLLNEFLACKTIWDWQNEEKMKQLKLFKKGGENAKVSNRTKT